MEYNRIIKPPESRFLKSGRVTLGPGEEVGEHITEKREELIVILRGEAIIVKEDKSYKLKEKSTFYIEEGINHNIINKTDSVLEYIFVVALFDSNF